MTRSVNSFLLNPQTEYQREFVWKREEVQVEVENKKPQVHLEYLSEYRREFGDPKERATDKKLTTTTTSVDQKVSVQEIPSNVIVETQEKKEKEVVQVEPTPLTTLEKSTSTQKIAVKDSATETGDAQKKQVAVTSEKAGQKQERVEKEGDLVSQTKDKQVEIKSDSINTIEPAKSKPKPVMAPYGIGNVQPVIPEHHMKTFNVRAPQDQVAMADLDLYHNEIAQLLSAVIPFTRKGTPARAQTNCFTRS
jgi:hypothetical protein